MRQDIQASGAPAIQDVEIDDFKRGKVIDLHPYVKFDLDERSLEDDEDTGIDLVQDFHGKITCTKVYDFESDVDEDEDIPAGKILGVRLAVGDVLARGLSLLDVCDSHSAELLDYYETFLDEEEGFLEDLNLEMPYGDLLIIHKIEVNPQFRGHQLGLLALLRTIKTFGEGCAMVAIKPFPLQFENKVTDKNQSKFEAAQKKLRRYWAKLGFVRFEETDQYYLDLAYQLPKVNITGFQR